MEHRGPPTVERVGQRDRATGSTRVRDHAAADRSAIAGTPPNRGERMDRRTDVVQDTRQREFLGSHSTTRTGCGLEHRHVPPRPRQADRGHEAVWPGTDDDRTATGRDHHALHSTSAGGRARSSRSAVRTPRSDHVSPPTTRTQASPIVGCWHHIEHTGLPPPLRRPRSVRSTHRVRLHSGSIEKGTVS